ncbi:MAG: hypothetical protein ACTSPQ_19320 [Candidatus Helarchaeota archaeon]
MIKRFGDEYREYRKKVPAIIVRPKDLPKLIKIMVGKQIRVDIGSR